MNVSTPFDLNEHNALWKNPRYMPWGFTQYRDFNVCIYLRFRLSLKVNELAFRSTTPEICHVYFPNSGRTMEQSLQSSRTAAWNRILITTATWKLSVCIPIGNVN
jgi:hypothetical protein